VRVKSLLLYVSIALGMASPALASGPCLKETKAFRSASEYLWEEHAKNGNLHMLLWASNDEGNRDDPQVQRRTLLLLFQSLNTMAQPDAAPDVTPEALETLAKAVRCVKRVIRSRQLDPRLDNFKAIEQDILPRVAENLRVKLDLGAPL
jgi:hypothetical protein